MKISKELLKVAKSQDGLVDRAQAIENGMTAEAIRHELSRKAWQRVAAGIYATFSGDLRSRHYVRAALLHAGPEAVVTAGVACAAYGMQYVPNATKIVLLVPHTVQRAKIDIATVRRARHMPASRNLRGFPCAVPPRAALDAAREAGNLRDTRAVLCEVVQRALTPVEHLLDEAQSLDQRSSAFVRQALSEVRAGCRSAPECEARDVLARSNVIPSVRWNLALPDPRGEDLIPDGCIPEARLVLEIESMEWHQFGEAPELTERRRARYASLGWRVMPISPRRIRQEPDRVLLEVEQAYIEGIDAEDA